MSNPEFNPSALAPYGTEGLLKQQLVTTHIEDGMLRISTTTRTFRSNGEYRDTTLTESIVRVEPNV